MNKLSSASSREMFTAFADQKTIGDKITMVENQRKFNDVCDKNKIIKWQVSKQPKTIIIRPSLNA